jgi:soluble lytic murein transglycosylase
MIGYKLQDYGDFIRSFNGNLNVNRLLQTSFGLVTSGVLFCSGLAYSQKPSPTPGDLSHDRIREARKLAQSGKYDAAVKSLGDDIGKETDKSKRALEHLALAVIEEEGKHSSDAEAEFSKAIDDGLREPEYAYFERGMIRKTAGRFAEADADFQKVIVSQAPLAQQLEAHFQLADILVSQNQTAAAIAQYAFLQKKTKSNDRYPDVLFELLKLDTKRASGSRCKMARELYSKFPAAAGIHDWGPHLENDTIDGKKTGCSASSKDFKSRIRRLQLAGEAERAAQELESLKKTGKGIEEVDTYSVDSMLADHEINEGLVNPALALLLHHYDTQKMRPPYLLLLAKGLSRAGEYPAAVAVYQQAYEVAPRGKDAASALFQAAFTGYQMQDYDGSTRRFEQLVHLFPGSHLATDARWHLAWMRYLRGEYEAALDSFHALLKAPKVTRRRRRRRQAVAPTDTLTADRLQYWSAMSLMKLGRNAEAIPILQNLVKDPAIGYYAILSYYRLAQAPSGSMPPGIEARLGFKKSSNGQPMIAPTEDELKAAAESVQTAAADEIPQAPSPDAAAADDDDVAGDANAGDDDETETPAATAAAASDETAAFKDTSLAMRFQRARDLALVGLDSGARLELSEIEKHARKPDDRRLLMAEYAAVGNYFRSSEMAELGFSVERLREGLHGDSRRYWEFAWPKAWEGYVNQAARTTSVPEELIWGIMRAESHYRTEAQSNVGALGLMQMMPFTGRKVAGLMKIDAFDPRQLLEPETGIRLGSRYLQRLLDKFPSSVPLVAAAYNAGPHRVHAWVKNFGSLDMDEFIEHIPFMETRNYTKRVVRNYQIYSLLYSGGAHSLKFLVQPVGLKLSGPAPTSELW